MSVSLEIIIFDPKRADSIESWPDSSIVAVMVSKAVCTSAKEAIKYFEDHLNVADYFVEDQKLDRGQFIGKVAERLGLQEAAITRDTFVAFAQCDTMGLGAGSKRQRASEIKYIEGSYLD